MEPKKDRQTATQACACLTFSNTSPSFFPSLDSASTVAQVGKTQGSQG